MVIVFDLDDTLYDEKEFVKSGFKEISKYLGSHVYYDFMLDAFNKDGSGKIFNKLIESFDIKVPIEKLIEIYRFHTPNIFLPQDSLEILNYSQKYKTALISDGHYIMQKNKFNALKLSKYINYPIFTDFYHTNKPELKPYEMVMTRYKDEKKFIYISDNPTKDFIAVDELGWIGIRYKNSNGIYKSLDNNTNIEVKNRKDIINVLRKI